jgi:hypothetical protein
MTANFGFFITSMPDLRSADYYLGCLDGCVFLDFNNQDKDRISLKRISFDGYGCCELGDKVTPLDVDDSQSFKIIIKDELKEQDLILAIVKKTIALNRQNIWAEALEEYNLN